MATLSNYVLEKIGFVEEYPLLQARFTAYQVFDVRGIERADHAALATLQNLMGATVLCAIDASVNRAFKAVFGIDLTADEEGWRKEHSVFGPILLVSVPTTTIHTAQQVRYMRDEEKINTHKAFTKAKQEAREALFLLLPSIRHRFEKSFAHFSPAVSFVPVECSSIGWTQGGEIVYDWSGIGMSATAIVSSHHGQHEVQQAVAAAESMESPGLLACLRPFFLAADEEDPYKKFWYYMLSLEIATKNAEKNLNSMKRGIDLQRFPITHQWMQSTDEKQRRGLKFRFSSWAVHCLQHLHDDDVFTFHGMVDLRNELAHGDRFSVTNEESVSLAELAKKVVLSL